MALSNNQNLEEFSTRKLWAYRLITACLAMLGSVYVAETALRWNQGRIAGSDALAPGMIQYDADLGWKLTPGWSGRHDHHDYTANYSINALGLRNDAPVVVGVQSNRLTMVVGDSFTFGLGVNDDATFVHHLNAARPEGVTYSNGSVPGFSTDQEALLIEKRILALRPDVILLVVYVGNDLFDNARAFPLQASNPKPYFEITDQGLTLRNSPVPMERKPRDFGTGGLVAAVWGADPTAWNWRTRWEQQSELFRLFSQSLLPEEDHRREFAARFAPSLKLFDHILERIAADCEQGKVKLTVVTLAGRSFIESPGSASAQYQDLFREHVMAASTERKIAAIDLAKQMKIRAGTHSEGWFYPNEGHLNPAGHKIVAEILSAELSRSK